jgi:hypothetical protein
VRAIKASYTAVIAIGLVAASAVSTTAQDEGVEPSEAETRVEVPEGGYAVTFPEFWQHFRTTTTDASGMVEMYGVSEAAAQWLENQGELGVLLVGRLDFGSQSCLIQSQPSDGSVADEADALTEAQSRSPSVTSDVSLTMHQWSVGEVAQLDFIRLRADGEEEFVGFWLFSDGATFHSITCHGQIMLGEEYWQSIAESFEFLPEVDRASTSARGDLMTGRIERPERGFAVTFPDGWEVWESTDELQLELWGELPYDDETPLLFAQHQSGAWCQVADFTDYAMSWPAMTSVEEAADTYALESAKVWAADTPAGEVGRSTGIHESGWVNEVFIYIHDERWIGLFCNGPAATDDLVAIGDGFEVVPAG